MAQSEVFHIKAIADFSQPEKEAARIRTKLDREINSAFRNMEKSFGQPLGHITGRLDDFTSSLEASNARVLAFGASAGIVYQVSKAFRELIRSTIDVEKSMADIQVVLNANVKQLEKYRSGIFNIAKQTGQSFSEVSKAATELARQGLTAEKTLIRLKDALILSRLSGMDTIDSVEALTAAINGYGQAVINSTSLVNKFATVDQKFAVSSQDLAEAFKRVGSTAVDAGVNIDQLIGLVTSAQQITARGGSVIGNSFKTIFTRIQRPQVLEDLENSGIAIKNLKGESLGTIKILQNLASSYDTLTNSQKSFVSEAVGGVFQINVLKAILKDVHQEYGVYQKAVKESENATDAAAKKNELLNKTLDSLINKSIENLREFGSVVGESTVKPVIANILGSINVAVEYLIKNKDDLKSVFNIIGNFLSGPALGIIAGSLIKLFTQFVGYAGQAAIQMIGLTKRSNDIARIQASITTILQSHPSIYQKVLSGAISVQQAERITLNILREQAATRSSMMNFSAGAAKHAFQSGVRVDTKRKTLTGIGTPNFADPLGAAISREISSGFSSSQVKVGMDSRLKSRMNPMGIGVYNIQDEPLGLSQGVSRAISSGLNPKTHGIANFASASTQMKEQARLFANEMRKVLLDPKVQMSDKQNLAKAVSKSLNRSGFVSLKGIRPFESQQAKSFSSNFSGRAFAMTNAQKSTLIPIVAGLKSGREEMMRQARTINPSLSQKQAYDLANMGMQSPDIMANYRNYAMMGKKQSFSTPYFSFDSNVVSPKKTKIGSLANAYQGVRNLSPASKFGLLAGAGLVSSVGASVYERNISSRQDLSEMEKKNRTLISQGLMGVLTGAGTGAVLTAGTGIGMVGGAAIGALIGGGKAIYDIITQWNDVLPDLEKNLKETGDRINDVNNTFQNLMSAQFEISQISTLPVDKQKEALKRYTETFRSSIASKNLAPSTKKQISSLLGSGKSPEEIMGILEKLNQEETQKSISRQNLLELSQGIVSFSRGGGNQNFVSQLIGLSDSQGDRVAESIGSLNQTQLSSIRERLQKIQGNYGAISNPTLLTSAQRFSKSSESRGIFAGILQDIGLDKSSDSFGELMKSFREDMNNGGKSLAEFSKSLAEYARNLSDSGDITQKVINDTIGKIRDLRNFEISRIEGIRTYNRKSLLNEYDIGKSIMAKQFAEEFAIQSNQMTPMTPIGRDISELQIGRNSQKGIAKLRINQITNRLSRDIYNKRSSISDYFDPQSSLMEKNMGQSLDILYSSVSGNVSSGNIKAAQKELLNGLQVFQEKYRETGSELYKSVIPSIEDLLLSLDSSSNEIYSLNEALEQNIALSRLREDLLKRQIGPNALGDNLRSYSATYNAERRMGGIDPSKEITSSFRSFREEMGYTVNDFYTDFENSARDAAQTFKSEFKSAFNDFRRGSIDAGEALRQFAINVLDRIATNASNMAIDSLLNAAFGGASNIFANVRKSRTGGMVRKRYADGGMVTGGSGVIDDVPALLTSGEMVINREAVRTYGADYFNKINQGRGARAKLENRFLYLDDKGNISSSPTQGEARVSAALSNIGATNELMRANTDRFSREQRFVAYVQQRRAYNEQRSQAMKRYEKGIRQQAIAAGVSAGIGIGGSAIGSYFDNRNFANNAINSYQFPSSSTSTSYGPALPPSQGVIGFKSSNSGSIVPNFGSSNRDNIPYSLTGGEAVLRKEAVSMYGQQFVKDLNNGQVKTMRFGSQQSGSDVYSDLRNLPSSIDRLSSAISTLQSKSSEQGQSGSVNNQFSFNIEVKAGSGEVVSSESSSRTSQKEEEQRQGDYKKVGEVTKMVAIQAIQENLRPGGMIYNAIRGR